MILKNSLIIFDNNLKTYYPGQNVTGRVELTFDSPKTINEIVIICKGKARTYWTETDMSENNTNNRSYGTTEEYFNMRYSSMGGTVGTVTINEGKYSFPFAFTLPQNLPSSFEGRHGSVRYAVKVTLDKPWAINQSLKEVFNVISLIDLNLHPEAKKPISCQYKKTFCCLFCKSGPLIVTADLPYTGFVPEQSIPLHLKCTNSSNVDVDGITIKLQEVATFYAASGQYKDKARKTTTHTTITKVTGGAVEAMENRIFQRDILIPSIIPLNLTNCNIIDLNYQILIILTAPGLHRNAKIKVPITIGILPVVTSLNEMERHNS